MKTRTIYLLLLCLGLALLSAPAWSADEENPEEAKKPVTQYVDLAPPIIVNVQTDSKRARFLQVRIVIQVEGEDAAEEIKYHSAPLRNDLIMLLSNRKADELIPADGREKLRAEALDRVRKTMAAIDKKLKIDDLLFTGYVVQ